MKALSVPRAARVLGISEATLRRWIRDGAPCVQLGGSGRGKGSLVDVDAIRQWRGMAGATDTDALLPQIMEALGDVLKRDGGDGRPAHQSLGIRPDAAAALLTAAYRRIEHAITKGKPITDERF